MLTRMPILLVVPAVLVASAAGAADAVQSGLKPGKDLPSSFEAFSVVHASKDREGKYHSPVCEFGIKPAVLVFVNEGDEGDAKPEALNALLKKLDDAAARHQDAEFGACATFLNDGGYREALETKTDDLDRAIKAREAEAAKLRDVAKAADLKNVSLSLDAAGGPKDYQLNPAATVTVLVLVNQQVRAGFAFSKDKPLTAKDVDAIMAEVEKLFPKKGPERGRTSSRPPDKRG